jgi:hypothetical protein
MWFHKKNLEESISSNERKILKRKYLQVEEKSWRWNIFKWCKNLDVDSLSGYHTNELWLVKEYNTKKQFGIWGMDIGLPNHIKKWACKFSPLPIYLKYFNYIVGYCTYLN